MPPATGRWAASGGDDLATRLRQLAQLASSLGGGPEGGHGVQSKGWLCQRADCQFAVQGRRNWPERDRCWGCMRCKSDAMHPPSHARVGGKAVPASVTAEPPDGGTSTKEAKKRAARARKRAGRLQAAQARGVAAPQTEKAGTPAADAAAPGPIAAAMAAAAAQPAGAGKAERLALPAEVLPQRSA